MLLLLIKMHFAKEFTCRVTEKKWLASDVVSVRFEPSKKFDFRPGQFLSVIIPRGAGNPKPVKRCYSFACSPEDAFKTGYEICVRVVRDGLGSEFLKELDVGDLFKARAPYGDFGYRTPEPGRSVCFISTGTGLTPFRSVVGSALFREHPPKNALCLFGGRTEKDLIWRGVFEAAGVTMVHALSRAGANWKGYRGRVTDYLRHLPKTAPWHLTDFYVCGNGEMVREAGEILRGLYGVPNSAIHQELFSATTVKIPANVIHLPVTAPPEIEPKVGLELPWLKQSAG